MVVVIDEGFNLGFEVTGQEVVFQQDAVLQCLMPAFDLALGLRVIWRAARVLHTPVFQPFSQVTGDIARPIVAEKPRLMNDVNLVTARCLQCEIQRVRHILSSHVGAKLPGHDVAAVIVQNRTEIEPAPAQDFDVGEVGLPELVDRSCFVFELIGCLDDDEGWAGNQVMRLKCAIHCGFRDKVAFLIRERHRQLTRRQLCLLQGEVNNFALHLIRNAVPNVLWLGALILQTSLAALQISIIPAIERRSGDAQFSQCQAGQQVAFLDQPDDFQFL